MQRGEMGEGAKSGDRRVAARGLEWRRQEGRGCVMGVHFMLDTVTLGAACA